MACGYFMSILRNHVNHDTFGFSLEKTYMYLSYVHHLPPIMVHMGGHQVVAKKHQEKHGFRSRFSLRNQSIEHPSGYNIIKTYKVFQVLPAI